MDAGAGPVHDNLVVAGSGEEGGYGEAGHPRVAVPQQEGRPPQFAVAVRQGIGGRDKGGGLRKRGQRAQYRGCRRDRRLAFGARQGAQDDADGVPARGGGVGGGAVELQVRAQDDIVAGHGLRQQAVVVQGVPGNAAQV